MGKPQFSCLKLVGLIKLKNLTLFALIIFWVFGIFLYTDKINDVESSEFKESVVISQYGFDFLDPKEDFYRLTQESVKNDRSVITYCEQKFSNGLCKIHGNTSEKTIILHERSYALPTQLSNFSFALFLNKLNLSDFEKIRVYMTLFLIYILIIKIIFLLVINSELQLNNVKLIILTCLIIQCILNITDKGMGIYNIDRILPDSPTYNEDLNINHKTIMLLIDQAKLLLFPYNPSSYLAISARGSAAFIFGTLYLIYFITGKIKYLHIANLSYFVHFAAIIYLPFIIIPILRKIDKKTTLKYLIILVLFLNFQLLEAGYIRIISLILCLGIIINIYRNDKNIEKTSVKSKILMLIILIFTYYVIQIMYVNYVLQYGYPTDVWIASGMRELTGRTLIAFQPLVYYLFYIGSKKLLGKHLNLK
jgi:hypothetical protein